MAPSRTTQVLVLAGARRCALETCGKKMRAPLLGLAKSIYYALRLLRRARVMSEDMLKVYTCNIRSISEYAVQVWQDISAYLSGAIESVYNQVVRVISPETWVMLPEILVRSPEETNTKKVRISLWIGNNVEKFFITKALFVSENTMKILKALFVPNNKAKRCSFPTTKWSVVRLVCNRFLLTDVS